MINPKTIGAFKEIKLSDSKIIKELKLRSGILDITFRIVKTEVYKTLYPENSFDMNNQPLKESLRGGNLVLEIETSSYGYVTTKLNFEFEIKAFESLKNYINSIDLSEFTDNTSGYAVQDPNNQTITSSELVSNYSKNNRKKQMSSNFKSLFRI